MVQTTVCTIDVLFIQRPTNALHCGTLELPFYIVRVNRFTGILHNRVTQPLGRSCFRVYLNINDTFLNGRRLISELIPEGSHPGAKGYAAWAKAMEPKIA